MPPPKKRDECDHEHRLKRTIGFNESEIKQAKAKGLSLPDYCVLDFCMGCWAINPQPNTWPEEKNIEIKKGTGERSWIMSVEVKDAAYYERMTQIMRLRGVQKSLADGKPLDDHQLGAVNYMLGDIFKMVDALKEEVTTITFDKQGQMHTLDNKAGVIGVIDHSKTVGEPQ